MDACNVKLVVVKSACELYKEGDEIVFDGPVIQKEKKRCLMHDSFTSRISVCICGTAGSSLETAYTMS